MTPTLPWPLLGLVWLTSEDGLAPFLVYMEVRFCKFCIEIVNLELRLLLDVENLRRPDGGGSGGKGLFTAGNGLFCRGRRRMRVVMSDGSSVIVSDLGAKRFNGGDLPRQTVNQISITNR